MRIDEQNVAEAATALHRRALLVRPHQRPDEGPCGYLMRLADENELSYTFVCEFEHAGAIALQADGRAPVRHFRYPGLSRWCRFCPSCLSSRQAWLDSWELPMADACPICGDWLIDVCSSCGCHVPWARRRLLQCDCGGMLTAEQGRPAPDALVRLSRAIQRLSHGGELQDLQQLSGLTTDGCMHVCAFLASIATLRPYQKIRSLSEIEHLSHSWHISSTAAEVLSNWPNAFVESLSRWKTTRAEADRGSLSRVFENGYRALYGSLRGNEYEFLRIAFSSFVAERWTGSLAKRNRRLRRDLLFSLAWVPAAAAAKSLNVSTARIRQLVMSGKLLGEERVTDKGRRFVVVHRESMERDAAMLRNGLTLDEVSRRLGLSERRLAALIPHACPEARAPVAPGGPWAVPEDWVKGWEQISTKAPLASARCQRLGVSFAQALQHRFCDHEQVASFMRAVKDGRVSSYWRVSESARLVDMVFSEEVIGLWAVPLDPGRGAWLSMREVASRLSVKQEVTYHLAKSKLLRTQRVKIGRRMEARTSESWLSEFQTVYVFGRDLANKHGRSPRAVADQLLALGVRAVAGPGVDTCRQLVYSRAGVERALGDVDPLWFKTAKALADWQARRAATDEPPTKLGFLQAGPGLGSQWASVRLETLWPSGPVVLAPESQLPGVGRAQDMEVA